MSNIYVATFLVTTKSRQMFSQKSSSKELFKGGTERVHWEKMG